MVPQKFAEGVDHNNQRTARTTRDSGIEGTQRSITILNRLVSWGSEGITWEGDPRHAEILIRELGVTGARVKPLSTKDRQPEGDDDEPIHPDQAKAYRSLAMRAKYVPGKRPSRHPASLSRASQGYEQSDTSTLKSLEENV